jgi:hypothetical protein
LAEASALSGLSMPPCQESGPPAWWRSGKTEVSPSPTRGFPRFGSRESRYCLQGRQAIGRVSFRVLWLDFAVPGQAPRSCHRGPLHSPP